MHVLSLCCSVFLTLGAIIGAEHSLYGIFSCFFSGLMRWVLLAGFLGYGSVSKIFCLLCKGDDLAFPSSYCVPGFIIGARAVCWSHALCVR